jgi:hypothetical protein
VITEFLLGITIQSAVSTCPIVIEHGQPRDTVYYRHMARARTGCVEHYGPGSCLVRFVRTGEDSYWAICRRGEQPITTQLQGRIG